MGVGNQEVLPTAVPLGFVPADAVHGQAMLPVAQPIQPMQTQQGHGKFGSSLHTKAIGDVLGEVGHYDFAPAPFVCCGCLIPEAVQKRTFFRAFASRVEMNRPVAPCCCLCDNEKFMIDRTEIMFYDKPPFRSGMCCVVIPAVCCGPPVVFVQKPTFCCCDLSDIKGQEIRAAPCNCWGLKKCCCCCEPCYIDFSRPIIHGVKDPERFLVVLASAVKQHAHAHGIPADEVAVFDQVSFGQSSADVLRNFGSARSVQGAQMQQPLTMSR